MLRHMAERLAGGGYPREVRSAPPASSEREQLRDGQERETGGAKARNDLAYGSNRRRAILAAPAFPVPRRVRWAPVVEVDDRAGSCLLDDLLRDRARLRLVPVVRRDRREDQVREAALTCDRRDRVVVHQIRRPEDTRRDADHVRNRRVRKRELAAEVVRSD